MTEKGYYYLFIQWQKGLLLLSRMLLMFNARKVKKKGEKG